LRERPIQEEGTDPTDEVDEVDDVNEKSRSADRKPLIPARGGYRKLKSFQVARLIYDVTARFCERYIDPRSRTRDQMVQAARCRFGRRRIRGAKR
jgi:hypothetical protein